MFHPIHKVCFHEWRPVERKTIAVNTLVFHSEKPTWLFCEFSLSCFPFGNLTAFFLQAVPATA
jgi:hypothetical protein